MQIHGTVIYPANKNSPECPWDTQDGTCGNPEKYYQVKLNLNLVLHKTIWCNGVVCRFIIID